MNITDLYSNLQNNSYPGRGIVLGMTPDGKKAAIAYFIMGRSVNSRNRVFVTEGDDLRTQAHDPAKLTDPSLVIYFPVRTMGDITVVTNGDQTDTIYNALESGETFADALRTRMFEPDPPILTPRISGLVDISGGTLRYKLSILKSAGGNADSCERFFYEYDQPVAGQGRFIHTYQCDGDPIPSFAGDPVAVGIGNNLDAFTKLIWDSLNEDNKVSLFTRFIDIETGEFESRIVNKNN